jgi:hypothetical protein
MSQARRTPRANLESIIDEIRRQGIGERVYEVREDGRILELTVRVTRSFSWDENKKYADAAVAHLSSLDYWPSECGQTTSKKTWGTSCRCSKAIAYAVIHRSWHGGASAPMLFAFVCRTHAEKAKVDREVLAVVELLKPQIATAKKQVEARIAERGRQLCQCGHPRVKHDYMTGCETGERGAPRCACSGFAEARP